MKTEMLHQTIETLIKHNDSLQNKGAYGAVTREQTVEAIDHAISVLMDVENLIQQRGRHNTEIAYKAMEMSSGAA